MGTHFEHLLDALSYEELQGLKKDLDQQGLATKRSVEEKLKRKMREFDKTCAVCLSELRFYSTSNYTIVFGPDDFKKKASFCGLDCLQYFIDHLKRLKAPKRPEQRGGIPEQEIGDKE